MIPRWSLVAVHHSKGADSVTRMSFDEIRKFHTDPPPERGGTGRGWSDVGYHRVVESVEGGLVAITGRPENKDGSHASPKNHLALGLCFVGDFDLAAPEDEMLRFGARYVVAPWIDNFGMDFPGCVLAHRDITPGRKCPGALFPMLKFIEMVGRELGYVS